MTSQEDREEEKEDRKIQRAISDLAKSVKEIKKKNWERYKDMFPALYAEEFGIDRSIDPQIQKIMSKEHEKMDNTLEENRRLKEDIKELKRINRLKDKEIEKRDKYIEKRNKEITKLKEEHRNVRKE